MYIESGQLIFSPSDLTSYMESPFASWMEHLLVANPKLTPAPDEDDPLIKLLQKKGDTHEKSILTEFEVQGLTVVKIKRNSSANELTIAAIKAGPDVIYQACLGKDPMKGYADFLVKVPGKSLLGDYHYEVWDTKLSKTLKPYFIIQLCCYAEMLKEIQGCFAENIVVVLGDGQKKYLRLDEYYYFYQQLKVSFLEFHAIFDPKCCPDPMASNAWGRWANHKNSLVITADHLSQVATITKSQTKKLNAAGIKTMQQLAMSDVNYVKGISADVLARLKNQADLQKRSFGLSVPIFKFVEHQPLERKGLALLPLTSLSDLYFDLEGAPLVEGGLEYLWGVVYFDEVGERKYKDYWAHNQEHEKNAFKSFITWAYDRWHKNPGMHIYHYGHYEIAACRRLMSRYGVCEYELDQLLRNEVFVDLYKIVKGSLLLGEPKYSIKNVEHLYRDKRETEVTSGIDSVVVYENWRESPDGDSWESSEILRNIRNYNIDDCNSTQELVGWLSEKQLENGVIFLGKTVIEEPEVKDEVVERIKLRDRLLARSENLFAQGENEEAKLAMNLAWMVEFNRRESKPIFWRLFDRLGQAPQELVDDADCLANCVRTDRAPFKPTPKARNLAYEYKFDPDQEFKATCSKYYVLEEDSNDKRKSLEVCEESNLDQGLILLKAKTEPDKLINLIPDEYVHPEPIPTAIARQVSAYEEGRLGKCAILDFLNRSTPRIHGHELGQPIVSAASKLTRLDQIINAVVNLDNSYLTIQGPPGAGKTYTAKHVIAALLKKGKKIGISSNSHKAINNLLKGAAEQCQEDGVAGAFACTRITDDDLEMLGIKEIKNGEIADNLHGAAVIGTTAWGFSREDLAGKFDYLFIDEAGQLSVAYLVAMSQSTKNIVLIGDQMQLGQPSQGSHPEDSGMSILDYLLHDHPTISDYMGVFLNTTYRMHSAINHFISGAVYEGKLTSDPANDNQTIEIPDGYTGLLHKEAGIIYAPVEHEGNTQASDEEVKMIVQLANDLVGRNYTDKNGETRNIDWDDILFVAPYNFQVNKLKSAFGGRAKVGSVDKFQGQEAPIVFLSMCASDANETPRGVNFLFDKNRINVAISRAQCLAIVVANPKLAETTVSDVDQMSKLNVYCRLIYMSTHSCPVE